MKTSKIIWWHEFLHVRHAVGFLGTCARAELMQYSKLWCQSLASVSQTKLSCAMGHDWIQRSRLLLISFQW